MATDTKLPQKNGRIEPRKKRKKTPHNKHPQKNPTPQKQHELFQKGLLGGGTGKRKMLFIGRGNSVNVTASLGPKKKPRPTLKGRKAMQEDGGRSWSIFLGGRWSLE